jgi:predicted phage tail protein
MVTLKLYGWLRKFCGAASFEIEVQSSLEAIKFLLANFPKLEQLIGQPDKYFRIWTDYGKVKLLELDELTEPVGSQTVINFAPAIYGRGDGFWNFLGGLALVGLVVATGGAAGFLGTLGSQIVIGLGVSLALGGLAQMLTPVPKPPESAEDPKRESYSISGIVNTSMQGIAVPVIYGEIIVGSALISLGLKTEDIDIPPQPPKVGNNS